MSAPKTNPKGKEKRKPVDWEAIEREYRLGQLSNAEIGHLHGISKQAVQKHASNLGWEKDLTGKVAALARAKLSVVAPVVGSVVGVVVDGPSRARAEEQAVDEGAARVVAVVIKHRKSLARMNDLSERLMEQLDKQLTQAEEDTPEKAVAEQRLLYRLDLGQSSKATAALAAALSKVIPLERQAFNVDGAKPAAADVDNDLPESIRERLAIYRS